MRLMVICGGKWNQGKNGNNTLISAGFGLRTRSLISKVTSACTAFPVYFVAFFSCLSGFGRTPVRFAQASH